MKENPVLTKNTKLTPIYGAHLGDKAYRYQGQAGSFLRKDVSTRNTCTTSKTMQKILVSVLPGLASLRR
ncbi:MAG TPA: hypothetical protein VEH58_00920 [Dehalococcoidales bacterium]|nr:hypothetical protein [Dehalococcoidales bacterium]